MLVLPKLKIQLIFILLTLSCFLLLLFCKKIEKLETQKQMILPLDGFEIQDIESITQVDKNKFLIFGSHSRNKKCKIKKSRLRFAYIQISKNDLILKKFFKNDIIQFGA
ncbi:MAG: hypothetical protein H7A23_21160 [Leptospiraceae bacterium]|nr:hypothetical protein [Leptospiraceae bacterium]MCP5497073.1 hypothetical protein [Leptospiraceae bacterium]